MTKLKAVSLFSGCGGFDWGATQAGVDIIWANDIDSEAAFAYRSIFPEVQFHPGDIRDIVTFPDAEVLIGCYPCTGFSQGARRKWRAQGQDESRERDLTKNPNNFLFTEFARALGSVNPKYFFVENVTGMVSAHEGWFLNRQKELFSEAGEGYKIFVTQNPLNASHFGVAQERKRIFIVGVRKDLKDLFYKFPKPSYGVGADQKIRLLEDVIGDMELWPEGEYYDYPYHGHYLTRNRKRLWNQLSYTIVAHASHVPLHPMGEPMVNIGVDKWELRGKDNRRLSWRECARIQGLPDHIQLSGSLISKYRVIGNAVPPAFGKALVQVVVDYENGNLMPENDIQTRQKRLFD